MSEAGVEGSVEYVDDRTMTWRATAARELTIAVAWHAVDLPFRRT